MKGVVIKSTGSWYNVRLDTGEMIEARIVGKFRLKGIRTTNPIAVGDHVILDRGKEQEYIIKEIEDRKNYIIRKSINLSKRSHIIASNIDQALVMVTLSHPKTYTAFIDRFLVTAEAYHIPVVILFNKIDLYDEEELKEMEELMALYESIGYQCIQLSVTNAVNVGQVKEVMKDKVSMISGHSGVGKSTLINYIEPGLKLATSAISETHNSGKHTTTFAEMHPLSIGGYIIDTPGIRAFGLIDFDKHELSHCFPEMRERLHDCQFNNCVHINEPNCAIKEALANDEIKESRYLNYLAMYEDDDEESYRQKGY